MKRISAIKILRAVSEGQTRPDILKGFNISNREYDSILKQLVLERDRRATDILRDLKSGMTRQEIAGANGFRHDKFNSILQSLEELELLSTKESNLFSDKTHYPVPATERRCSPRVQRPVLVTKIYESSGRKKFGTIMDLSVNGLRTRGIQGNSDSKKVFSINIADFREAGNLEFECECRWVTTQSFDNNVPTAGFEITRISEKNLGLLKTVLAAEFQLADASHGNS